MRRVRTMKRKTSEQSACAPKQYLRRCREVQKDRLQALFNTLAARVRIGVCEEDISVDSATVIRLLDPFLSEARKLTIQKVITRVYLKDKTAEHLQVVSERTFNLLPVVEGLINDGNVAAVMRSADAMGCGALHCIEAKSIFKKTSDRCSAGADKWLHQQIWSSPNDCLCRLKSLGYTVLAADASESAIPIHEVDWSRPTAVVFGNEGVGVSSEVLDACDQRTAIPMRGFVESFNISVAAAIVLYEARRHRALTSQGHGDLTADERRILQAVYYLKHRDNMKDVLACQLRRQSTHHISQEEALPKLL